MPDTKHFISPDQGETIADLLHFEYALNTGSRASKIPVARQGVCLGGGVLDGENLGSHPGLLFMG